jgi:hypothetical protein
LRRYRLYGEVLGTNDIALRATPCHDAVTVHFEVRSEAPEAPWAEAVELHSTPVAAGRHVPDFRFFRLRDRDVIRIEGSADVHLFDDQIVYHLLDPARAYLIEIVLGGLAFAFWLERRGTMTLHGSASVIDGTGVGFLADGGMGKSSLASFLTANDCPLISEDLLVVSDQHDAPLVHPGLAQLRLWPEQAAHFVDNWEELEQPHPGFTKRKVPIGTDGFGAAASGPVPLRRLYVLQRLVTDEGTPQVVNLSSADAMEFLLMHSYLPEIAAKFQWQSRRFLQLSDLLGCVTVSALRYPTGLRHLPAVRDVISGDLRD